MKKGILLLFVVFVFLVLSAPANYAAINMDAAPEAAPIDAEQSFTFAVTAPSAETFVDGSAAFYVDFTNLNEMDYDSMSITAKADVTITGWTTDGRSVTVTGINAAAKLAFFDLTMLFTMPSTPGAYTAYTGKYNLTGSTPNVAFDSTGEIEALAYTPTVTQTITPTVTETITQTVTETVTETTTATITQTITQTFTSSHTPTMTPTFTNTPTKTPTPPTIRSKKGKAVRLHPNKEAGLQIINVGPCYLIGYQNDSRGNTGNVEFYNAVNAAGATAANYQLLVIPAATSETIFYGGPNYGTAGLYGPYFPAGLVISRTAANMEGQIYIYIP